MNELIQELVEQASKHVTATVPFNDPSYVELGKLLARQNNTVLNAFKEKFAELIVRECCFVGEQYADGLFDSKHYAFVNKKIKEHFGVEE